MQLRNLLQDDDAVSPVIGVILMVAITVILAAVIASFVLGLGDTNDVAPNPTFEYDYDSGDGELDISVKGGDSFTASDVELQSSQITNDDWNTFDSDANADSKVSAGNTATVTGLNDDFELDIVWTSEDGESSSVIGSTSGPDA